MLYGLFRDIKVEHLKGYFVKNFFAVLSLVMISTTAVAADICLEAAESAAVAKAAGGDESSVQCDISSPTENTSAGKYIVTVACDRGDAAFSASYSVRTRTSKIRTPGGHTYTVCRATSVSRILAE